MTGLEPQDRKPTSCREAHQERRKDTSWRSLAEHSLGRGRSGNRSTARGSHLRSKKVRMTPTSVWPRWLHTGERAGVQASGKRCLSVPSLRIPHGCAQDVGGGAGGGWSMVGTGVEHASRTKQQTHEFRLNYLALRGRSGIGSELIPKMCFCK